MEESELKCRVFIPEDAVTYHCWPDDESHELRCVAIQRNHREDKPDVPEEFAEGTLEDNEIANESDESVPFAEIME